MNKVSPSLTKGLSIVSALVFVLLISSVAFAQAGSSSLRGIVTDQKGSPVKGANVTLTNEGTTFTRSQTTNDDGAYVFTAIPPGTYRLEVEAAGFKKAAASEVHAQIDTPGTLDVQLEVGNVSETVSVVAGADAPINTSDATIGNTFESRRIVELPLNANNVVGLLSLQPGVTQAGFVNGGRSDQANITLDGVDVNEQQSGLDVVTNNAFSSVLRVLRESTQEFRVVTTNPNADTGRSSGAQVSLATKSGTNDIHGSWFYFHRNTVTSANDFFSNKAGRFIETDPQVISGTAKVGDPRVPRPPLLRNFFGGSVGGPIKKDRAFYFFAYEGFREATSTGGVIIVPLPHIAQGIVRYRTANGASDAGCPAGTPSGFNCLTAAEINSAYLAANGVTPGVNSTAVNFLSSITQRFPANDTTVGDGINTGGFRFNAPTPTNNNTYVLKFDFNLTDSQTLFVRGNYQNDEIGQVTNIPDQPGTSIWYHPKGFA
ncbi:MAG TPA: carboxypeptidase-like regulatory domain-containing protein, partial [Pyrinomonadaceae bacterium]|nr:carboxypeptidase-like regulatory domain-containing protein [Pyrinomonadaceae bacterium]